MATNIDTITTKQVMSDWTLSMFVICYLQHMNALYFYAFVELKHAAYLFRSLGVLFLQEKTRNRFILSY